MIKIIKKVSKEDLEKFIYDINLEDKSLYDELLNKNSIGIFQFCGKIAKKLVGEIHPKNFDEMNAVNAMSRPGPIENVSIYKARKEGEKSPYPKAINEVLKNTYGVLIYQEQMLEIFHKIGGFSLEEADEVRNLMKKLGKTEKDPDDLKKWKKVVSKFVKGAMKNDIDETIARKVADDLISFSSYSFNLSHSTSYSYIAIMTLYLSIYFRQYFYSAFVNDKGDEELLDLLNNMKMQGFKIIPPNINHSKLYFTAGIEKQILFGLSKIKHVSEKSGNVIIENRPYKSLIDFILKTRKSGRIVTSAVIKALISIGVFDEFDKNRKKMLFVFNRFWEKKKSTKIEERLRAIYNQAEEEANRVPGLETSVTDIINYEKEYFGFNFFATLFTQEKVELFTKMSDKNLINLDFCSVNEVSKKTPVVINNIRKFNDKNENEMAFIEIEDMFGMKEKIPVFHSYFQYIGSSLVDGKMYLMNLYRSDDDKIMFGTSGWVTSEFKICRMIKSI